MNDGDFNDFNLTEKIVLGALETLSKKKKKISDIIDDEMLGLLENNKFGIATLYAYMQMPNWPKAVMTQKIDIIYRCFEIFFFHIDKIIVEHFGNSNLHTQYSDYKMIGWGEDCLRERIPTRYISPQCHYAVDSIGKWFIEIGFVASGKVNNKASIFKKIDQVIVSHTIKAFSPILLFSAFRKLLISFYESVYLNEMSLEEAKSKAIEAHRYVMTAGTAPYIDDVKKIFKRDKDD